MTSPGRSRHPSEPDAGRPSPWLVAAHRTGELRIGAAAQVVATASAHRGAAFEACRDLVEEVTAHPPVWKDQFFADSENERVGSA
ncbi:molybdenum cofactor biosynthesis protein MoaE [Paeniglutamicibacter psychrophenolicus]|uniref:molybdenum cofactor biosynthesis protein MoaE n=1 Tax=Paeniglutamicibacter psychrophenolicus TaxID=257454 RepID=UPI0031CFA0E3